MISQPIFSRAQSRSSRVSASVVTAAVAALSLFGMTAANAAFIVGFGSGTAIPGAADRVATFDAVVSGQDLSNYSENLLSITVPNVSFTDFDPTGGNGGFSGGFHYPSGGVNAFTVLTTTDAAPIFAAELSVGNGFSNPTSFIFYQAYLGTSIVSSGALTVPSGSVVTFSDTDGFSGIRLGAYSNLATAQTANSGTFQALALDNVRVNVSGGVTVPEAGTFALALPALAAVGAVAIARRRKK